MNKNTQILTKHQKFLLGIVQLLVWVSVAAVAQTGDTFSLSSVNNRRQQAEQALTLAQRLMANRQFAKAEVCLDQAISLRHNLTEAYLLRATLRKDRDDLAGAITDYSSAIHLQPDYLEARFGRAQTRYQDRQYDAAREDFQYLLDQSDGITNEVFYRGDVRKGTFVASSATTLQSDMKSDWLNYIGLCFWHTQDYSSAERFFVEAMAHAPQDPMGYVNLGLTHEARGDTLRAIHTYQRALAVAPSHSVAQRNLLVLARQRNDTTLEQQILTNSTDGPSYDYYLQRGLFHLHRNEFTLAIRQFEQALTYEPQRTEALLHRGYAQEKTLRFSEALADYTAVIQLDPTAEKAYSNRGNIYFRQEKYAQALDDYARALSINPDNATVWLNRGLTYHRRGERAKACQDLRRAVALGSTAAAAPLAKLCAE